VGTKTPRPDTIDPEMQRMIDRYVDDALAETGTSGGESASPRGRFARASVAPLDDFMAPPSVDPAAELVRELAMAMAIEPDPTRPPAIFLETPVAEQRFVASVPAEFVDESPTDLSSPPTHIADDDEATGVFSMRRSR
jgi:hypothetical protein